MTYEEYLQHTEECERLAAAATLPAIFLRRRTKTETVPPQDRFLSRTAPHALLVPSNPRFGSSMPNETEAMALALIRLLHEATDGPMEWRNIRRIDGATDGAVALAAERGWLQRDDFGRVALTDAGREVAQALGRRLH